MHEVYDINWTTLLGQGMFAHVIRAACAKKGVQYAIKVRAARPCRVCLPMGAVRARGGAAWLAGSTVLRLSPGPRCQ
jgi:hypothetical protein